MSLDKEALEFLRQNGREFGVVKETGFNDDKFIIYPSGCSVKTFQDPDAHLKYIKQAVEFSDYGSFIEYVQKWKRDETAIFCDIDSRKFYACLDYHGSEGHKAGRKSHVARLELKTSFELQAWLDVSGGYLPQMKIASFLEDNFFSVVKPEAASLLETVTYLKATKKVDFLSGVKIQNNTMQFEYKEEVKTSSRSGEIEVPEKLEIQVPVFRGDITAQNTLVRLNYDISKEGALSFQIVIPNSERLIHRAAEETAKYIQNETGCPLYYGVCLNG